ncbi:hypothetical protein H6H03_01485 [Nostoc paludosum FACHB-159]|uniref:Uncharacterized protein n=1 Tax=Nostoc paludosum FACHB-159 TaxID=2692908 RepID=A0ABR8JZ13_9NOSO|nr:hypothetical protein [Nostoc paludosum FACHB-159]
MHQSFPSAIGRFLESFYLEKSPTFTVSIPKTFGMASAIAIIDNILPESDLPSI